MAYYDQGYNVGAAYGTGPRTEFGTNILGGLKAGQGLQAGQLAIEAAKAKAAQQAQAQTLGQQYAGATGEQRQLLGQQMQGVAPEQYKTMLGNEKLMQEQQAAQEAKQKEFLARSASDILQAPSERQAQMHDEMIREGIKSGALPQEAAQEIGQFGEDDIAEMKRLVRGGQEFEDITLTEYQKRSLAQEGKDKIKPVPATFAKTFNERLAMDIGEDLDELPKEDVKLIRDTTSAKMREGQDFEQAYTSTLQDLGLQETGAWFGDSYKLTPRQTEAPQTPEQVPTGQSINQSMPPEAAQRLEQIRKRRAELEAMRGGSSL